MRYLRLYSQDTSFKADEINAGGTGNDVEAMVPGIVKTADLKKMYFNPHDKTVQFHTLTIYYENSNGEQLAECKTMMVKYISGVTQEIVVTPKNIDGYIARKQKIVANIPEDTSIVFYYKVEADYSKPLTFNIISGGTLYWKANSNDNKKTIEYKKNNNNWTQITSSTEGTQIVVAAGDVIQFRGNNSGYSDGTANNFFSGTDVRFSVEGNIMSLISKENFSELTTLSSDHTFRFLFNNCESLISAGDLLLPAMNINTGCYNGLFVRCSNLILAPELPATTVESMSYIDMFAGCTSLTTAPDLPATTLARYCYESMFSGCTSLTTSPELPAITLAYGCYSNMFCDCTSLTTAPDLPATTLASNCYYYMFFNCTSLRKAQSVLPATTLTEYCYRNMFAGCTNLITAPDILATSLAPFACFAMFEYCTSLTAVPSILPATTLAEYCYKEMFLGCTSLTTAPVLPADVLARESYSNMFRRCTSLSYIKCLATNISASSCTAAWVDGVSSAGTFVKNQDMILWTTGGNGIPSGWTVQDATS